MTVRRGEGDDAVRTNRQGIVAASPPCRGPDLSKSNSRLAPAGARVASARALSRIPVLAPPVIGCVLKPCGNPRRLSPVLFLKLNASSNRPAASR